MDNDRLRQLAGMEHNGKPEMLQEMRGGKIDTVRSVAYQLHQLAEERAYGESEEGHQAVTGDAIFYEYERLKAQMDQYVQELIKGEQN